MDVKDALRKFRFTNRKDTAALSGTSWPVSTDYRLCIGAMLLFVLTLSEDCEEGPGHGC